MCISNMVPIYAFVVQLWSNKLYSLHTRHLHNNHIKFRLWCTLCAAKHQANIYSRGLRFTLCATHSVEVRGKCIFFSNPYSTPSFRFTRLWQIRLGRFVCFRSLWTVAVLYLQYQRMYIQIHTTMSRTWKKQRRKKIQNMRICMRLKIDPVPNQCICKPEFPASPFIDY